MIKRDSHLYSIENFFLIQCEISHKLTKKLPIYKIYYTSQHEFDPNPIILNLNYEFDLNPIILNPNWRKTCQVRVKLVNRTKFCHPKGNDQGGELPSRQTVWEL